MANHLRDADAESEVPNLLLLLSRAGSIRRRRTRGATTTTTATGSRVFECKTCSKTFPTFQALGGHRTGHKRQLEDDAASSAPAPKKAAHECPVCGLVFPMGQALGGHMRRHKDVLAAGNNKNNSSNDNDNNGSSKCNGEEDDDAPADSTGASDLLSGCSSSDARHGDHRLHDDHAGFKRSTLGSGFSPRMGFVDLELRLGMAPPAVITAYDKPLFTTLSLGIHS